MRGHLSRLVGCRRATAALEFGIIVPMLLLLLSATVDIGGAMLQTIRIENAARAGAQFAMSFPDDTAGISAATTAALGGGAATIAVAQLCACPGGGATPVDCNGTPCAGAAAGVYRTVTVTTTYDAIVGIGAFVVPDTLTGEAIARVR
jgi:Flp pilus assembly protein TadG